MIIVDESDPIDELEPTFPYRDVTTRRDVSLREAYEVLTEIGRGKFGRVFQCKDRETGLMLAAKVVTTKRKDERRNVEREIEIMKKLQHPRLIQLFDAIDDVIHSEMCLILEMVGGGELFDRVIQDEFVLTERACAVFVRQISEAVEYIHSQNVLHLDMKPENVMCLSKKGNRIKIIDFGLARFYDPTKKLQVLFGTPEFVAPEVVNFEAIDYATDMWSIGVITYVLLSGLSPFMGETDVETMANVTIAKYDFDDDCFDDISDDAKDFISKLLVKDKKKRMTASQSAKHRWLMPLPRTPEFSSPLDFPTTTANDQLVTISSATSTANNNISNVDNDDVTVTCLPTTTTTTKIASTNFPSRPPLEQAASTTTINTTTKTSSPKTVSTTQNNVKAKVVENHNHDVDENFKLVKLSKNTCVSPIPPTGDQSESESGYSGSEHSESSIHNHVPIISSDSKSNRTRLDLTKDNLRDFVARWTDTPYLFDSPNGIITHLCNNEIEKTIADAPTGICHVHHYHNIPTHNNGSESNLSNGSSFECGVNIVNQIRRFSYQLHEELQMMKNHCNKSLRKCSWGDVSVNAQ